MGKLYPVEIVPAAPRRAPKRYPVEALQTFEEARAEWLTPEAQAKRRWAMTASYGPDAHRDPEDRERAIRAFFAGLGKTLDVVPSALHREDEPPDELADMIATTLRHHRGNLSEWEETFFESVDRQVRQGRRLSDKQRTIVERVVEKTSRLVKRPA